MVARSQPGQDRVHLRPGRKCARQQYAIDQDSGFAGRLDGRSQLVEQKQCRLLGAATAGKFEIGERTGWVVGQDALGPDFQYQAKILVEMAGKLVAFSRKHIQLIVGKLGAEYRWAFHQPLAQPPTRLLRLAVSPSVFGCPVLIKRAWQ